MFAGSGGDVGVCDAWTDVRGLLARLKREISNEVGVMAAVRGAMGKSKPASLEIMGGRASRSSAMDRRPVLGSEAKTCLSSARRCPLEGLVKDGTRGFNESRSDMSEAWEVGGIGGFGISGVGVGPVCTNT